MDIFNEMTSIFGRKKKNAFDDYPAETMNEGKKELEGVTNQHAEIFGRLRESGVVGRLVEENEGTHDVRDETIALIREAMRSETFKNAVLEAVGNELEGYLKSPAMTDIIAQHIVEMQKR